MRNTEWLRNLDGSSQLETALNVRWFLVLLELPGTFSARKVPLLSHLLDKLEGVRNDTMNLLFRWMCGYAKEQLKRLVANCNSAFSFLVSLGRKV